MDIVLSAGISGFSIIKGLRLFQIQLLRSPRYKY